MSGVIQILRTCLPGCVWAKHMLNKSLQTLGTNSTYLFPVLLVKESNLQCVQTFDIQCLSSAYTSSLSGPNGQVSQCFMNAQEYGHD